MREPASSSLETQPAMMSFKAFLQQQDDAITDEEAISKYNEYKLEFKRLQLNEFFVAHKEEEWFKMKYHPEDSVKRKEEQNNYLKKRLEVFTEFLRSGSFDAVRLDADQTEALIRMMDRIVIRLEGGNEADWLMVEASEEEPISTKPKEEPAEQEKPFVLAHSEDEKDEKEVEEEPEKEKETKEESIDESGEKEESKEVEQDEKSEDNKDEERNGKDEGKKRKRDYDFESGSESEEEEKPVNEDKELPEPPPPGEDETKDSGSPSGRTSPTSSEPATKPDKQEPDVMEVERKRKDLHKTASIFLRTLAPSITKAEVEAMCRRYPGFLRVALAEPQYERRWFRRGWVTFERFVNIKEICWNLNNIRLRDCELGAIVNKDLTRRVRTVSGVTSHKQVVRNDIKIAARITHTLDARNGLWGQPEEQSGQSFGLVSSNPVLKNITDYLIEEASAEEEELLGTSEGGGGGGSEEGTVERDETLINVLDKLLFYLRIVYSIDYYNHCEYPQEDEMPNRCGLIHVRGPAPSSKVAQTEILDYCKQFEAKISSLVASTSTLTAPELTKLGAKHSDKEVEKFIQSNTQELSKDKWLCPLSGKKFKGPDFVRKHIQNKHGEKVQEVVKEVEFFNNYLADPRRPMLPEHPGVRAPPKREPEPFSPPAPQGPPYSAPYGGYGYAPRGGYYGYPGYRGLRGGFRGRGGMPMQDMRPVIHYRDLDAPRESEEFI